MDKLADKIASTLKWLRNQRGWSLDSASEKTGVSKAMLGQIERGESSPTIATLWKIASGFEVAFSTFVEEPHTHKKEFIHSKQALKQLNQQDDKIRVMPLFAYDKVLGFEMFIIELLPGCEHLAPAHQKGVVEHVVVASGEIDILINRTWHSLKQHEGMRFNADKPHGYRNTSRKKAIFHDMVHYSSPSPQ